MAANSNARRRSLTNSRRKTTTHRQYRPQRKTQQQYRSGSWLIYLVRLIILGLGASTIVGTTIAITNPPKLPTFVPKTESLSSRANASPFDRLKLTHTSPTLDRQLQSIGKQNSKLAASYLFIDPDSGEYSEFEADRVLPAASTIKLPIAIALFQDIDRHKVRLDEKLTIDKKSIAGGSGDLQTQKPGTQVSVAIAVTKMIEISDNTATNLIIDRLGGMAALNQRFRNWGLKVTTLNQPLPDLQGKNVTTASELAVTMSAISRGKVVSDSSRLKILGMMSNISRNTMLPQGLGKDAKIAHKTGDIGALIADVGSIDLSSGKNYIAAVLVRRPHNDPAGPAFVRKSSKLAYEYFRIQPPTARSRPTPAPGFPHTDFIKKN
jgi:beta-lactamase class A